MKMQRKKSLKNIFNSFYPDYDELLKALVTEKKITNPVIPGEKASTFKYLLREYIYKFRLVKWEKLTSAYWAGKSVNIILRLTYSINYFFIILKIGGRKM